MVSPRGRLNTATLREFNGKWRGPPPKKSDRFIFACQSEIVSSWHSPRSSGTLWENKKEAPEWLLRDQARLEKIRNKLWPVNATRNPESSQSRNRPPQPQADLQSTRHIQAVLRNPEKSSHLAKTIPFRSFTRTDALRSPTPLQLPAIDKSSGSEHGKKSRMPTAPRDADQKALDLVIEERRKDQAMKRRLTKQLRNRMQQIFTDTTHLPINLWKEFKKSADHGTGRINFQEYCVICSRIGLDENTVGKEGQNTLFEMADRDGSGEIDFSEFLNAIVGNLVSLSV